MMEDKKANCKKDKNNKYCFFQSILSWCYDNLFLLTFYLLALVAFIIYNDFWVKIICRFWVNPVMSNLINKEWIIIIICTFIFSVYYFNRYKYRKIFNNKQLPFFIILAIYFIGLYIWCYYSGNWNYSLIFNSKWLPYTHLIFLPIATEIIITIIIKCKRNNKKKKDEASENKPPFEIERTIDVKDSYKRNPIIQSTFDNINKCFYEECSFNIGITGTWGSGKTTFIKEIKRLYEDFNDNNLSVLWFEPWKNDSPDSIVKSFFNTLSNELKKYIPGFSSTIDDYISLLLDETDKKSIKTILNVIKKIKNDNSNIYNQISESLKEIKHKTVIFIDDIDRLDSDEINAVLRIIRNTANFPFIQFIAAYDKEYVISCIDKNETKLSNTYLDKFFNIEITLPKYEDRIICHELHSRISEEIYDVFKNDEYCSEYKIREMIYVKPQNYKGEVIDDNYLIPMILTSLRDVIRFYNTFKATLQFYKYQNIENEIYFESLFYIELLRYKYNDVYMLIRNHHDFILEKTFNRYSFNKENDKYKILRNNWLNHHAEEEINIIEHLITLLFGTSPHKNSIKKDRSFDKYFMFRLDNAILTYSEFLSLISLEDDILVRNANELYKEKYIGEFKIIIEELLRNLQSSREYRQKKPPQYKELYNTLSILSTNENSYSKSEVCKALLTHISDLSSYDLKHLSAKLNLLNNIDSYILDDQFNLWDIICKILNKNELHKWVYKKLNGNEKDIVYQFLSNTRHEHLISPIITKIIESVNENELTLEMSVLLDIRLNYFLNYKEKTSYNGMILFQNCIDHIENVSDRIIIQDKALNSMKSAIINDPEEYLTNFVIKEEHKIVNTYSPDPYYIQIFGSNDNFEEFLNSLQENSNINKVKEFWSLYKNNKYAPILIKKEDNNNFTFTY